MGAARAGRRCTLATPERTKPARLARGGQRMATEEMKKEQRHYPGPNVIDFLMLFKAVV